MAEEVLAYIDELERADSTQPEICDKVKTKFRNKYPDLDKISWEALFKRRKKSRLPRPLPQN